MEKNYKEIKLLVATIDSAMKTLKEYDEPVCCSFNGEMLDSDDDLDSAYMKVTGKTKAEFEKARKERSEQYESEKAEHKANIPQLTKKWIEKGKEILDDKYHDKWIQCVPIRLNDIYRGMELNACLEIVEPLNSGCKLEEAENIIEKQGHSGASFNIVCSMVKSFCDRGNEFVEFVK